jgi:cytochrome P450
MQAAQDIPVIGKGIGQLRQMQGDRLGTLRRFNDAPSDIGRISSIFGEIVLVNTPELIHDVLVTRAKAFEKSPVLRGALHPLAGQGLFTSEGELWRRQRKLMAPLFQPGAIGHFAEDMTECAERSAKTLVDGAVVDMSRETTRITMAIAGKTLFDADTFADADELGAALTTALDWVGEQSSSLTLILQARASIGLELLADRMPAPTATRLRSMAERTFVPILWPGQRTRSLRAALGVLEARVARMIAERREHPGVRRDLLSLLLSASSDDDGGRMTDQQVRDEVLTLFVAGHETTATGLAWTLMLLAKHPEVYARVRREVDAIGRTPTVDDLGRLPVALAAFKEALRLYPPVYLFGRVATQEVQVGEFLLPKGTVVLVSPYALHRKPSLWPKPEVFDPDRFAPAEEARRHRTAYVPFSAGPRTCIGNHFALMEGPLVLGTLLHHADFELSATTPIEPEAHATLRPRAGIPMRVRLRRSLS